jgi:hypothetical protein
MYYWIRDQISMQESIDKFYDNEENTSQMKERMHGNY